MKHLIKTIFLLITFLASMTLSHSTVSAAELSQTDVIDSIQFSDSTLSQGHSTSVEVTFSEKNKNQINPGDSITLSLPPSLQGMAENDGSPRRIQLSNLGKALIYSNRVVATFNENVTALNNVSGHFSFGIKATVSNKTENEVISTNFGTKVVSQSITIPGRSTNTGNVGQSPFFYKTGDLLGKSNTVRWFLNANLNKEELHNYILITDTHGVGQTLNKDSFQITVDNHLGRLSYSLPDFIAKRLGSISFTTDNTFEVYIPREVARLASFSISYTTTITEAGRKQKDFENSYTLNYQPWDKPIVTEKNTFMVKNLFAEGDAQGNKDLVTAEEKEEMIPEETVESIEEVTTENATETVEVNQPVINVPVTEEQVNEETTDTIEEIGTENATESIVEDNTNETVEVSQPVINVPVTEEQVNEENTDTIEEIGTENATESIVEDNTNETVEVSQPVINVPVTEEQVNEENTDTIEEIGTENATESVVEDNTNETVEVSQPVINVPVTEEQVNEETTDAIEEIITDNASETVVEDNTNETVEVNQPVINVPVTEEHVSEETTDTIEEIITDNASETVVEDNTNETVEVSQPVINVPVTEEHVSEETTDTIEEIITDNASETVVEDNTNETVEVSQPVINVPVTEEHVSEETTDTIEEIGTENATESVIEDNTNETVEVNQPVINVPVTEEQVNEENTDTIEEVVTDNASKSTGITQPNAIKPITEKSSISNTQLETNIESTFTKINSKQSTGGALPKTGETNSSLLAILGLLLSSAVCFKFYLQKNYSTNN